MTITVRDAVGFGLVFVMLGVFGVKGLFASWRADSLDAEIATMRSEQLIKVVDSSGWETHVLEATADLEQRLIESRDSTSLLTDEKAALSDQILTLGGSLRYMSDMYAEIAGRIDESTPAVIHAENTESPDSATGTVKDGLLAADLVYRFARSTFGVTSYSLMIEMTTGFSELPDGRLLAVARATDERVRLSYGETFYQPPPPVQFCSVGTKAKWALYGAGAVGISTSIARAIGGAP